MMTAARVRVAKAAGLAVLAGLLALGFVGYLRPGFMVDLTNMVLAWCG
ncbi:hypothetical protein JJQ59_13280 [Cupriavidus necator]|jgi:hypothetical protein|nr:MULTISPECIES: hypothetical protein [Cupriavidus]KAI3606603.1 hypothetical protein D8I24_1639 [Cupriavidus necator H850]MDX6013589.1 hypothetical protein [Cupriavidus necator]QQX86285.1 hypothetical protein JJQ59_13280 [Cupriavidus necator]QUN31619.1 hypothetical protein KB879_25285 [Cupriavidus sp. KK10]